MFRAKKLLLWLIVGLVWIGGEVSVRADDADGISAGYLIEVGAIWVKQEAGVAVLTPPWDPHNLHVLELRFESSFAHLWWYRVPDRNIYFAIDHRGHDGCPVWVWIYYRDKAEHWQLCHYLAKVRGISDANAGGLLGPLTSGGAEAVNPPAENALPEPEMSEPDDGGADSVTPPSEFRLFPEEPAPGTGDADDSNGTNDFFQPAPPSTPSSDDTSPPFSSDLFPQDSP